MTSLKNYSGDEIAAALAEQLKDESFLGLYRKAEDAWWNKGPTAAAYKQEMDATQSVQDVAAVRNKYLAAGSPLAGQLGSEGIDDFQPLIEYAESKAASFEFVADDGQAADDPLEGIPPLRDEEIFPKGGKPIPPPPKPGMADDKPCGCASDMACDHSMLPTAAVNFTNKHLAKIANALDAAGLSVMADEIDGLMQSFAAKKKKHRGRSYDEWTKFFGAKGKEAGEKFRKTFKGALEHAKKEKKLSGDKAEEYAMRTALDKMPKSYFKEPGPEHGPGKSGKKVSK